MFNVSWEDPASETVAQHRLRKERPGSQNSSLRSGESSDSTRSHSIQRPPEKAGKQQNVSLPQHSIQNTSLSPGKRLSIVTTNSSFFIPESTSIMRGRDANRPKNRLRKSAAADTLQSTPLSNDVLDTTQLSWTTMMDSTTKAYEIQTLSDDSFIMRSVEVATSPQDSTNTVTGPTTEVHISADAPNLDDDFTVEMEGKIFRFPKPPTILQVPKSRLHIHSSAKEFTPVPPLEPELWAPPVDWDCRSNTSKRSKGSARRTGNRKGRSATSEKSAAETDLTHLTRHIRRMEAASPKIMLERMKEEWTEVADATIYKELEFEKQLWMMTALRFLSNKSNTAISGMGGGSEAQSESKKHSKPSKVLSLHENQGKHKLPWRRVLITNIGLRATASASFLATFTLADEIHHLSAAPLSPSSKPSIHPLTVPAPYHQLPYARGLFTSIHTLNLPAILASSHIPALLRECYRLLLPSGRLYLTILDPMPIATTLGPLTRSWLEKHLILNLEKSFRCMSPGRLLPVWLRDTGFACKSDEGADAGLIKFWAVNRGDGDVAELTVLVGRMLWKEIWGGFVEGERWWWDDDGVMEECERLGTRWDCAIVEAVKGE